MIGYKLIFVEAPMCGKTRFGIAKLEILGDVVKPTMKKPANYGAKYRTNKVKVLEIRAVDTVTPRTEGLSLVYPLLRHTATGGFPHADAVDKTELQTSRLSTACSLRTREKAYSAVKAEDSRDTAPAKLYPNRVYWWNESLGGRLVYKTGEILTSELDTDIAHDCGAGIHFFEHAKDIHFFFIAYQFIRSRVSATQADF